MAPLVICSSCRRHVRGDEVDCPFCLVQLVAAPRPRASITGRTAFLVLGAAALGGACSARALYGAPDPSTSSSSSSSNGSSSSTGFTFGSGGDGGMGGSGGDTGGMGGSGGAGTGGGGGS